MNTKRLIFLLFCTIFLFALAGCSENQNDLLGTSDVGSTSTSDVILNSSTDDVTVDGSSEYPWRVSIPTGPTDVVVPHPYVVLGEKEYYVRKDTPEVEQIGSEWTLAGTVNVSVPASQDTYDVDADAETIVSNCMPKGSKVYQWNYYLAVEYQDFYVIFQDSSVS
ncbi:MAG: hypothetical protein J6B86_04730 [Clostridia bacterium]|nr:hypothetical protein [Clostridia bacterium]